MKQSVEQVREVGSTRQATGVSNEDASIGDVLRTARKQLMTRRILIAIIVILLITTGVFVVVNGIFDRFVDYLIGLAE
ncbi:MAG: hypothetical protein J6040_06445 [Clostridiales bacterium]|nr:hypothetical protein [Clostridiales bacterium]MBQ4184828.1 hypothetical protein [Clostridiales bacterium]MBQ5967431.1 hypothetical protein [Clostridiales bacterium]MBQ6270327.1 hypothetical protein [Clostridiales bacterium]MCR5058492.1 hypothetical protein [Clostridiales bacterium]